MTNVPQIKRRCLRCKEPRNPQYMINGECNRCWPIVPSDLKGRRFVEVKGDDLVHTSEGTFTDCKKLCVKDNPHVRATHINTDSIFCQRCLAAVPRKGFRKGA